MSVPTVVQNDSASYREGEEDASSLSPSESASFNVTLDSAETSSSNPRSAQEHYISVSNAKQVLHRSNRRATQRHSHQHRNQHHRHL